MLKLHALFAAALVVLCGCPKPASAPDSGVNRCEADLAGSGLFKMDGTGASAAFVTSDEQLIGGENANGRRGDVLLQNDKVRFIVDQPGRTVGPLLSGGGVVDADLVRPSGSPGRDAFGRMALIYALGRLTNVTHVEVISDGSKGGPAIVAATGTDVQHDLLNLKGLLLREAGVAVDFVVDPNVPLPVRSTTYYVLSPGESRLRMMTAFCNDGDKPVLMPLVELMDVGAFELFVPGGCTDAMGTSALDPNNSCTITPSKFVSTQGDGVAYGVRSMSLADLTVPMPSNGTLGYGGVVGSFVGNDSLSGILSWTDAAATTRPGTFNVRAHGSRSYLRDFYVAADLAGITSAMLATDGVAVGQLNVTAQLPGAVAAAGARVAVVDPAGKLRTVLVMDETGHGTASLEPGTYTVSAAMEGHLVGPSAQVTIAAGGAVDSTLQVNQAHTLTVTVADPFGAAMPAKVVVQCSGGACPFNADTYAFHMLIENPSGGAAAIGYVPPSGTLTLTLPPGEYDVVVSRGPEYSTWPDSWPAAGQHVDLRTADTALSATLAHVVDSTGWMSGDLHVHAINSSDSAVRNADRAANFMAEGVDVLLSTDHEWITDFAPVVAALHGENFIATMQGEEITTFTHGHFNAFPMQRNVELPNGGAFDHAGGFDGPTLRMPQFFDGVKTEHPGAVVQLNHPRGGSGVLSQLKVDTATLASHGNPDDFFMAPAPDATANDTRLFGDGFDIIEAENGSSPSYAVLNDWMTFLSRGTVRTSSGVSDTHSTTGATGGYGRTYVKLGYDTPQSFVPQQFADAIRAHHVTVSNGPFLTVTARKLDSGGQPTGPTAEPGDTLSVSATDQVQVTVDVQGPEWMQLDRIELYSHAPGREALNGANNDTWPDGRIQTIHQVDPLAMPVEAVPGLNGFSARRVHLTDTFTVTPGKDTWLVVMARGTTGRSMWPLHGSRPVAWSNAILIDGDGSGAYDDFPLKPGQPLTAAPSPHLAPRVPTPDELARGIRKFLEHKHE